MGIPQGGACPMPHAAAVPGDDRIAGPDADAHAGGIGAHLGISAAVNPDTLRRDRLAVPTLEPEDAVGFVDGVPGLDIGEGEPALLAGPHMLFMELAGEQPGLGIGEGHFTSSSPEG